MRRFAMLALAAGLVAGAAAAHAAGPTFATIDNPGDPTFNQLLGINNAGTISGYFGSGAAGHPNQAYTIAAPYTKFVPANVPDSAQTQATGINAAGMVTGFWAPTNTGTDANYGFIRYDDHGHYVYIDVNDPLGGGGVPVVNQVLGINQAGYAAGFYNDANGAAHGFVYQVATAAYRPVTVGGATAAAATGINNNNLICGFYIDKKGVTHGFLKPLTGGGAVSLTVPHAPVTQLLGVNSRGVAVGFYVDSNQLTHGVLYNPANGEWQTIDDPSGTNGTVVNGLNDKNELVGFYTDAANNVHGMLVTGAGAP